MFRAPVFFSVRKAMVTTRECVVFFLRVGIRKTTVRLVIRRTK